MRSEDDVRLSYNVSQTASYTITFRDISWKVTMEYVQKNGWEDHVVRVCVCVF